MRDLIALTLDRIAKITDHDYADRRSPRTLSTARWSSTRGGRSGSLFVALRAACRQPRPLRPRQSRSDSRLYRRDVLTCRRFMRRRGSSGTGEVGARGQRNSLTRTSSASPGRRGRPRQKPLAQTLQRIGPTVAPPGSFNNEIGHPLTVLRADQTTRFIALEVAARGVGHIAHLCQIAPPRIGVVLNVGSAHMGEFGSRDTIAQAKGELVEALPAAAQGGVAVLNADDDAVIGMARAPGAVVSYGLARRRRAGWKARPDERGRPASPSPSARTPPRESAARRHPPSAQRPGRRRSPPRTPANRSPPSPRHWAKPDR